MKLAARCVTVLLALAAFIALPFAAAIQAFRGVEDTSRAYRAALLVDEAMSVLSGGADGSYMSQRAANNDGYGWRLLAKLLETGWPGHLKQYKD